MNYIREHFRFEEGFRFQLFETAAKQDTIHCHDCLEINYVKQGKGHYIIEQQMYPIEPGDIFIINNAERHMAVHGEDFTIMVMVFDSQFVWENPKEYDYLEPFFNRNTQFSNRIPGGNEHYTELCEQLFKINEEYQKKKEGWQLVVKASVLLFLAILYRYCKANHELGGEGKNIYKQYERINPVLDYIQENYQEQIVLEDLAKRAMLNKTYMCTFFKEVMDMTIFEYIQKVRINHSCRLLRTTKDPITEIALLSGYNGVSYFNRAFKELLGVTPKQYRITSKDSANITKFRESKVSDDLLR